MTLLQGECKNERKKECEKVWKEENEGGRINIKGRRVE